MKSKDLEYVLTANSEIEARMMSDLIGVDFDEEQYKIFKSMKKWRQSIELYRMDCKERNTSCII